MLPTYSNIEVSGGKKLFYHLLRTALYSRALLAKIFEPPGHGDTKSNTLNMKTQIQTTHAFFSHLSVKFIFMIRLIIVLALSCLGFSGNTFCKSGKVQSCNLPIVPYFADMEYTIENETLRVKIKSGGAELSSIVHLGIGLEYMWQRNAPFWSKSSPILFPIVGALKDNTYLYNNKSYSLPRHGFAREEEFQVEEKTKSSITFLLKSSEKSLEKYPFPFELRLRYTLTGNKLVTTYLVKNTGKEQMLFSIGGHPAFKVPLVDGKKYEDYHILFNKKETTDRWPVSNEGLITSPPSSILKNEDRINITRALFEHDALVFKRLQSTEVSIKSDSDPHGLDFTFEGFPFLGIWAQRNADFVCIEPWAGVADSVNHNQDFSTKEGIEKIGAGVSWERTWSARFY
jgi:galactose mutarotase-like enzyme